MGNTKILIFFVREYPLAFIDFLKNIKLEAQTMGIMLTFTLVCQFELD